MLRQAHRSGASIGDRQNLDDVLGGVMASMIVGAETTAAFALGKNLLPARGPQGRRRHRLVAVYSARRLALARWRKLALAASSPSRADAGNRRRSRHGAPENAGSQSSQSPFRLPASASSNCPIRSPGSGFGSVAVTQ